MVSNGGVDRLDCEFNSIHTADPADVETQSNLLFPKTRHVFVNIFACRWLEL